MTVTEGQSGHGPLSTSATVVIADDDSDIRNLVEVAVTRAGGTVIAHASDGSAAWDAIKQLHPDLAILDVSMPELSGLEVCRLLNADETMSGTKVLLLSAAVHPEAIAAGELAGADLYGHKPFRLRVLQDQIRSLLNIEVTAP